MGKRTSPPSFLRNIEFDICLFEFKSQRMPPEQTATAATLISFEKQNKMDNMLETIT